MERQARQERSGANKVQSHSNRLRRRESNSNHDAVDYNITVFPLSATTITNNNLPVRVPELS